MIRSFAPKTRSSVFREAHPFARARRTRGNVFALLFGAVALTGVLAAVGMQTLTGPVTTITRVTQKNIAETNLLMNAKIISNAVPLGTNTGDPDSDNTKEAAPFVTAGGGETPPTNGGFLPTDLGLTLTDPWGTKYGYCVWDHGSAFATAPAGHGYIHGDNTTAEQIGVQPLIGVISAGPDKTFQTACPTFSGGIMSLSKTAGSDDLVQEFTYEGASAAANGLWTLNAPGGTTAQLRTADNSAVKVSVNRDTGVGDFVGVTTDTLAAKTDNIAIDGGLKLDVLGATPETCDAANSGVMRYDATNKKLVVCDGISEWKGAGSDVWLTDGTDVWRVTGNIGIGKASPAQKLDVLGNTAISGDVTAGGTGTITGDFLVGSDALNVKATTKFVGIGKVPTVALDVAGNTLLTGDAAITGDLTVDTDTLVVDATAHKVGINQATPAFDLDIIATRTIGTVGALNQNNAIVRIQENAAGPNLYMDGNTVVSDAGMLIGSLGNAGVQLLSNAAVAFATDSTGNSAAYGNLAVSGTLGALGATTLSNTLAVTGNTNIDGNTLFVDAANNNVGIGVGSPAAKLDVDGGVKLGLHQAGPTCTPDGVIQYNGSRMEICVGGNWSGVSSIDQLDDIGDVDVPEPLTNGQVLAWDDTANKWVAEDIINLGPAAVNPAGDDGSIQFKTNSDLDADKDYFHYTKATHRLGIGNASPQYTLDVTGTGNVSTDLTVGRDLGITRDLSVTRDSAMTGNLTVDTSTFFVNASSDQVGVGTNSPHASAVLDITSVLGGLLPPRMTTTQRNAIGTPADGLMLFNTTSSKLQLWDGTDWLNLGGGSSGLGSTMIAGWPDALNCGDASYPSIYYLTYAPLQADGKYHYRNILDSANYEYIYNSDKTYSSTVGTSETGCQNKSITTLYAQGRAFNFVGGGQTGEGGSMITDVPDALDCGASSTSHRYFYLQTATAAGYTYAFSGGSSAIGMQIMFDPLPSGAISTTTATNNSALWANAAGCVGKNLAQLASETRTFYMVGASGSGGGGGGGGVTDGDKGDITVSSSGTVWDLDAGVVSATELASNAVTTAKITDANVTYAKIQDASAGLSVLGRSANSTGVLADITGTADQVLRVNTAGTALGFGSLDLSKSGTVGTSVLPVANGGTNIASYTIGDLLYASGATTLSKLASGTAGYPLLAGGAGVAPAYGKLAIANINATGTTDNTTYLRGDGTWSSVSATIAADALDFSDFKDAMALDASTSIAQSGTQALSITQSGSGAGLTITNTGSGNSFLVEDSASTDSTPFVIGAAGNVGVGTASPGTAKLEINSGSDTAPAHLRFAGQTGRRNWQIGNQINVTDAFEITPSTANGGTTFSTPAMTILQGGNVGIGTTSPIQPLQVEGNTYPIRLRNTSSAGGKFWNMGPESGNAFVVYNQANTGMYIADGNTSWTANSDQRIKINIKTLTHEQGLAAIEKINPVTFNWRDPTASKRLQVGVIAQDVQKVLPELVDIGKETSYTPKGTLGVEYTGLIAPLIKAVQELKAMVDDVVAKVKELFDTVAQLKAENAALRAKVETLETQNAGILKRLEALEAK